MIWPLLFLSTAVAVEVKDLIHGDVYVETRFEDTVFGRFGSDGGVTNYQVDLSPLCGSTAVCNITHVKSWSLFVEFIPKGSMLITV